MNTTALHRDCVICLAKADELNNEQTLLVVVAMVLRDVDPDQVVKDLCFEHRRMLDDAS